MVRLFWGNYNSLYPNVSRLDGLNMFSAVNMLMISRAVNMHAQSHENCASLLYICLHRQFCVIFFVGGDLCTV